MRSQIVVATLGAISSDSYVLNYREKTTQGRIKKVVTRCLTNLKMSVSAAEVDNYKKTVTQRASKATRGG